MELWLPWLPVVMHQVVVVNVQAYVQTLPVCVYVVNSARVWACLWEGRNDIDFNLVKRDAWLSLQSVLS